MPLTAAGAAATMRRRILRAAAAVTLQMAFAATSVDTRLRQRV